MNEVQTSNNDKNPSPVEEKTVLEEQELRKKIVMEIEEDFMNVKRQKDEEMKKQIEEKEKEYHMKIK